MDKDAVLEIIDEMDGNTEFIQNLFCYARTLKAQHIPAPFSTPQDQNP